MIVEELFLKANFIVNPVLQKTLDSPMILKNEMIKRAFQEGIYFITDNENADKIKEESEISSPEPFISYGLKKAVFYAGIPDFAVACADLKLPKTLIALKLNLPYETLALFQMEKNEYYYKLSYPNLIIEPFDLKKVYLGLTTEEQRFLYQEISEDEYENYETQIPISEIKKIEKNLSIDIKEKLKELKKQKNHLEK